MMYFLIFEQNDKSNSNITKHQTTSNKVCFKKLIFARTHFSISCS